jgi:hypothetical protein
MVHVVMVHLLGLDLGGSDSAGLLEGGIKGINLVKRRVCRILSMLEAGKRIR